MESSMIAEACVRTKSLHGEGPSWHASEGLLYWVDIAGKAVSRLDPRSRESETTALDTMPGCLVPVASEDGRTTFLAGLEHGLGLVRWGDSETTLLIRPASHVDGIRFNDGKCDPRGRFWAGTMALDERSGAGHLYRVNLDGSITHALRDLSISNGLTWIGGTMYFIDSPTRRIEAFDFEEATGEINIQSRRTVIRTPDDGAVPDGMTHDSDGNLWVAFYNGSRVSCFDPRTTKEVFRVHVPASNTSSCVFGDHDLSTLYITTMSAGHPEEPEAGFLFQARPGVRGAPTFTFQGELPKC